MHPNDLITQDDPRHGRYYGQRACQHQWKKHGSCSGLSAEYFAKSREAYGTINQPKVLNHLDKLVRVPASVIEDAFVQSNPFLERDMITITCKQEYIQEARMLVKIIATRPCGRDVIKD